MPDYAPLWYWVRTRDRERVAYRNYYSAADDPDWNDLVERGMATKRKSPVSPDFLYHLTRQAAFYFLNSGERIDFERVRFPAETAGA